MGIHDRHYVREARGGMGTGGRGGWGGVASAAGTWSVNTWIIILCVAVYVIDGFTPQHQIGGRRVQLVTGSSAASEGMTITPDAAPDLTRGIVRDRYGRLFVPLVDEPSGVQVGLTQLYPMNGVLSQYLHFSTQRGFLQIEFWRLIGFQFLHANFMHLLFNMIGLFFFGPLVERYLGSKRYLAFYLICGICGALLYTALNLGGIVATIMLGEDVRIPGLLFNDMYTPLIGASAGVFGVLMAGAFLAPQAVVLLFFIIPMRLWVLAYALVAFALFSLITGGQNAGGEAGHIGGALAGFYLIRNPRHLQGFFDILGWADPTSHHYQRKPGSRGWGSRRSGRHKPRDQREVDRILDKISREGLQSLTEQEKRTLREASRD